MFKLTVVGGPAKGKSYQLREAGETSIGRTDGNDVVLTSQKVSKKHCVLVVNDTGVTVKDAGSSNGTFVNGILTRLKQLKPGDRVSVGEFVLELVKVDSPKPKAAPMNNVIPINGGAMPGMGMPGALPGAAPGALPGAGMPNAAAPPQNLQEKVKFLFEKYVLNFVYNLNEKHDYRTIAGGMFVVLTVAGTILGLYPVLDRVADKLTDEAVGRALVLARQMVDRNGAFLLDHQESRLDVAYIQREPNVTAAYIIDLDQRVMAPANQAGQNVSGGIEGVFAADAAKYFSNPKHEQMNQFVRISGDQLEVAVPLRVFSQAAGKNVTVAMGLVYYDRSMVIFDSSVEMLMYIQALILSGIVAVIIYFALYRLTMRPLLFLNEQIDAVLKGNAQSVEKKFKMEEIGPLIDVVNTALQRASQAGAASISSGGGSDEVLDAMKFAAGRMVGGGMMIFSGDKKVVYWGAFIEEITGVRADGAVGQDIGAVARDAAFAAFVEDMFARAPFMGSDPVAEDFEFSGTAYRMEALASGTPGSVKYWFITAVKPA